MQDHPCHNEWIWGKLEPRNKSGTGLLFPEWVMLSHTDSASLPRNPASSTLASPLLLILSDSAQTPGLLGQLPGRRERGLPLCACGTPGLSFECCLEGEVM